MAAKTISILSIIDVVSALAEGTLERNIYLLDNNKVNGSLDEGTSELKTKVKSGDVLVWTVSPIEPEVYVGITDITMDNEYCEPLKQFYEGTDVAYWVGKVKKDMDQLQYQAKYKVGTRAGEFPWQLTLIGSLFTENK